MSPISVGKSQVGLQIRSEELGLCPYRYSNLYSSVFQPAASHCYVPTYVPLCNDHNKGDEKPLKNWFIYTNDTGGDNVQVSFHNVAITRSNSDFDGCNGEGNCGDMKAKNAERYYLLKTNFKLFFF